MTFNPDDPKEHDRYKGDSGGLKRRIDHMKAMQWCAKRGSQEETLYRCQADAMEQDYREIYGEDQDE